MPLGRSAQKVNLARTRLLRRSRSSRSADQELSVATEVRNAGRNVNTNRRRVESTRAARILTRASARSGAEEVRVGLATSLDVLVAQRDLTNARNNELTAIIDYVQVAGRLRGGPGSRHRRPARRVRGTGGGDGNTGTRLRATGAGR